MTVEGLHATSASAFAALANAPRWVAWRNGWRGEGDARKLTKVPFGRDRRPAKADDPSTWITREEASDLAKSIENGLGGGIGIQLGDIGDGTYLIGFDLDSCLDGRQRLAPWAAEIIMTTSTYAETSPSGKGVKLFAFVAANDVRPFLAAIGVSATAWGTRRSVPGKDSGNHGPAIEVYCGLRFFTVTNKRFGLLPEHPARLDAAAAAGQPGPATRAPDQQQAIGRDGQFSVGTRIRCRTGYATCGNDL